MNTADRAETIAVSLVWLGGIVLLAWSWQVSGSLIAAMIITIVGGFFLLLLIGPVIAAVAFIVGAVFGILAELFGNRN